MIVYPGGTSTDLYATRYLFQENVFSDLGRSTTFLGESNLPTHILFTTALTSIGLALIFYFSIFPTIFSSKTTKALTIIGTINGFFTAAFYIGIGFTPYDVYGLMHSFFVNAAFSSSVVTILLYMIAIFLEKNFPNIYGWITVIFFILLIGYLYILFNGPGIDSANSYLINSIGQKIIVYSEIVYFAILAIGTLRIISRANGSRTQYNQKFEKTNIFNETNQYHKD